MSTRRRAGGGRAARMKARQDNTVSTPPFITRKISPFEVLDEEAISIIENNADTILEEIGIEFRDDPEALDVLKQAGCTVEGELVRFPRGMCRKIISENAPSQFTQCARNPEKNVVIGGKNTVFVPGYGSPFVRDLDNGRRYATLEDFKNFVKLAYMTPYLHHSGGTICEPVDVPVNKRHLDMVYTHMRYSDKPFMGSVTHPSRAEDTIAMCNILFGEEFVQQNTVTVNLINANSPMTFDDTMLGAAKVYARNNQACVVSPFILAGAMSPVTVAGTLSQILAEVLAGVTFIQLYAPGAPCVFGTFASSISMQSGAPTFGSPEPALVLYGAAQLARRLGLPFRSGGALPASKISDAQAAYETANTLQPTLLAGVNFALHSAGWLEGGLTMGYEKFVMDIDQLGMLQKFAQGVDLSENGQALDAIREVGPGKHFLGCEHTQKNFETAFYRSSIADNNSFEQWHEEGELDATQRANQLYKTMLSEYQMPELDPAIDEALLAYVKQRKSEFPDGSE
ncbi:trimethylamine methyltransferase family protein [Porticoccus sp. W117]|uniref:trimethylamine methyltransferase family protein n=1 Tax=Porticoccus sp. W117 TaxID=3054777 RepID=UPI002598C2D2|nr:trimethylamine methyltransferase family protein [Porticoccus sp. W117]MDM3871406.1 trimethylamine methyltransferase family protein [Porticoccus sp. W117]